MFMKKRSYLFLASSMLASTIVTTINVPGEMVAQAEVSAISAENIADKTDVVFSVEAFSLGLGYVVEPIRMKKIGTTYTKVTLLEDFLKDTDYQFSYDDTPWGEYLNLNKKSEKWRVNAKLDEALIKKIKESGLGDNSKTLSSFDETNLNSLDGIGTVDSITEFGGNDGWVLTQNSDLNMIDKTAINVGETDTLQLRYTLAKGYDLGVLTDEQSFYKKVNRDEATRALAYINSSDEKNTLLSDTKVKEAYDAVNMEVQQLGLTQQIIDEKVQVLNEAVIEWVNANEARKKAYIPDLTEAQLVRLLAPLDEAIKSLPATENLTLKEYETVQEIAKELEFYAASQQKGFPIFEQFSTIQKKMTEIVASLITNITQKINDLPSNEAVSLTTKQQLNEIAALYTQLPEPEKGNVANYTVYTAALKQYQDTVLKENQRAVEWVIELINTINITTTINDIDLLHIKAARTAYDELNDEQQRDVTNYKKLLFAEEKIATLNEEKEKLVQQVEVLINQLPKMIEITDKPAIEAARSAYNALTKEQQSNITNYAVLESAEGKLKVVEAENLQPELSGSVKAVAQLIDNLPAMNQVTLEHGTLINATMKAFNALSVEDQKKVPNVFQLTIVKALYEELELQENQKKAHALTKTISSLPSVSLVDLTNESEVLQTKIMYDQLTDEQKKLVTNYTVLSQLEAQLESLKKAALTVKTAISELPTASQVTEEHRATIEKTRIMYAALSASQKKLVTNYSLLEQAELTFVANQAELVKKLVQSINEWPVVITLANEQAIIAARKTYDSLAFTEQKAIVNYATLQSAEAQLAALLNTDKTAAFVVETMINDLPIIITLNDEATIEAARKAYQSLSASQKLFISNITILTKAEQQFAALIDDNRKEARKVMDKIELLPTKENLKLSNKKALQHAREQYNALKTIQKKYVDNYEQLLVLEKQLILLEKRDNALKVEDVEIDIPTIKNTTKLIEGYVTPGAQIVVYHGAKKLKTATVDSEGFYAIKIPLQKTNTTLKFIILNEVGDKLVREYVTVKAAKVNAATALKATATKVSGKSAKNKTVTIYKGSKKIRTTKSTAKGGFSAKIPTQKKGVTLKVIVSDHVGNKSDVKSVKVK